MYQLDDVDSRRTAHQLVIHQQHAAASQAEDTPHNSNGVFVEEGTVTVDSEKVEQVEKVLAWEVGLL
jgi:hypothetical protein